MKISYGLFVALSFVAGTIYASDRKQTQIEQILSGNKLIRRQVVKFPPNDQQIFYQCAQQSHLGSCLKLSTKLTGFAQKRKKIIKGLATIAEELQNDGELTEEVKETITKAEEQLQQLPSMHSDAYIPRWGCLTCGSALQCIPYLEYVQKTIQSDNKELQSIASQIVLISARDSLIRRLRGY